MEINTNINEFDILSMQFKCQCPFKAEIIEEYGILTSAQSNVYNTPNLLIDETMGVEDAIFTILENYQKVIDEVRHLQGNVHLYITHRTQKARELVISNELLRLLADKEIYLGVD